MSSCRANRTRLRASSSSTRGARSWSTPATEAGKGNVLHLAINSGTDLALFNALFTYIADQSWVDRDFIDAHTARAEDVAPRAPMLPARPERADAPPAELAAFAAAVEANRTSLEEAAEITGLDPADIEKAARWIAEPKEGGARRRTMFGYEKA